MMKIITNPFFKIIGIVIIIYLGLFHSRESEDNLRNRLSREKIRDNTDYIKYKALYIKENVQKSEEAKRQQALQKRLEQQNSTQENSTSEPVLPAQENEIQQPN